MNRVMAIMKYKSTIIILAIVAFAISVFNANVYHMIEPYHTIESLQIKVLDERNPSAENRHARILSIKKADGSYVDLESMASGSDWEYGVDVNILGYYGQGNPQVSISANTDSVVLSMIKQRHSGIVEIYTNSKYNKTIDLYNPEWIDITEVVQGPLNIFGMMTAFLLSFIILISTLLLLFYHIHIKKDVQIADLAPGILVTLGLAGLICIYAPLDLYFTNLNDFWYDFSLLLPAIIQLFLAFLILLSTFWGILLCTQPKLYKILTIVAFSTLITLYIQGNFFISELPPMDGTAVDWSGFASNNLITGLTFLLIIGIVSFITWKLSFKKAGKLLSFISGGLFLMLMFTASVLGITNDGLVVKRNMKATTKNEFTISSNNNFIIFVLDAVDSRTFWKVLDENPEYKEVFNDFTYYPDTVGAYSFTSRAIPFILSGQWFENEEPFERYKSKALNSSQLLKKLEEHQYTLGIYDQDFNMNLDIGIERFENQVEIVQQVTSWKEFLITCLGMGGIKYAPYNWKAVCYNVVNQRDALLLNTKNIDATENFTWHNTDFYRSLKEKPFDAIEKNAFKFIHLEGAHVPYQYNKNMEKTVDATYETNIEACITLMKLYIDSLKESGAYDNSTIIFMSDHGYWSDIYNPENVVELRQNPMLLIKGFHERHAFQVSEAPISYDDLQTAYARLLEGKQGEEIFDAREGDVRERRYLYYVYLEEEIMKEYLQTGNVWTPGHLQPTDRVYQFK